jgi:hypothetical protein
METLIIIAGGLFIADRILDGDISVFFLAGLHNFLVKLFFDR